MKPFSRRFGERKKDYRTHNKQSLFERNITSSSVHLLTMLCLSLDLRLQLLASAFALNTCENPG